MKKFRRSGGSQIGCVVLVILFDLTVGAWSVSEILSWFGKDIPLIGDIVIGLFAGQVSVPVAIVGWILKICGVF